MGEQSTLEVGLSISGRLSWEIAVVILSKRDRKRKRRTFLGSAVRCTVRFIFLMASKPFFSQGH